MMDDDYYDDGMMDNDGWDDMPYDGRNNFRPMGRGNDFPSMPMRGRDRYPSMPMRGGWGGPGFPPDFRNARYSNAYGNYRGGYGPGGGFGPPPGFFNEPDMYDGPAPPPLMGQGFGPDGPPKRTVFDPVKFLLRCGLPKENLKGVPRRILKLVDPQYCGICGLELESFAMSRMHYVGKNHQKKTKALLRQDVIEGEIRRAKEAPLKSRELYCELCDVQITSKSHAEAHYAGKPHRAVVEGRKQPKNPTLLQRGMESRVEQLIRREKRALKAAEDAEEAQPVKEEDKKITTPPELYCEICKTCVTCSEQMTMHLNGKRHLTKEKQHILKMMKGDTSAKKNEENPETENGENAEEEEEEEKKEDKKEGEEETVDEKNTGDDWENNGEQWEDASIY